ncbi:hypothetical protein ATSB10_26730 [Dyella thiooxydans]|uniref:Uncharacterized protein n=1 Tax=Dyella thiooxydans TaxID=445710 RepID=A0A160N380_9GAMM|nr:hypothetical protein ATSB10_26730 [Dyella thiooxydans]
MVERFVRLAWPSFSSVADGARQRQAPSRTALPAPARMSQNHRARAGPGGCEPGESLSGRSFATFGPVRRDMPTRCP